MLFGCVAVSSLEVKGNTRLARLANVEVAGKFLIQFFTEDLVGIFERICKWAKATVQIHDDSVTDYSCTQINPKMFDVRL